MKAHIIIVEVSVGTEELSFGSFIEVLRTYQWIKHQDVYTIHVVKMDTSDLNGSCSIALDGPGVPSYEVLKPLP